MTNCFAGSFPSRLKLSSPYTCDSTPGHAHAHAHAHIRFCSHSPSRTLTHTHTKRRRFENGNGTRRCVRAPTRA
eukprot:121111-Pleurochrysis_carterae.AAC.1